MRQISASYPGTNNVLKIATYNYSGQLRVGSKHYKNLTLQTRNFNLICVKLYRRIVSKRQEMPKRTVRVFSAVAAHNSVIVELKQSLIYDT